MPTYADDATLLTYAELHGYADRLPADAGARANLLEAAELDIDQALGAALARDETTGLVYTADDVAALDTGEAGALARAVCAQVLYRIEMGPEHFIRAQRERVSGRAFSAEGKLPIVGPGADRELRHTQLVQLTTTSSGAGGGRDPRDFQRDQY